MGELTIAQADLEKHKELYQECDCGDQTKEGKIGMTCDSRHAVLN
jgi:hypothetical protein